jgi:hypothetical protein
MPRHQIIAAHVVTATIKFTGTLLVMMRPGRFSSRRFSLTAARTLLISFPPFLVFLCPVGHGPKPFNKLVLRGGNRPASETPIPFVPDGKPD